jgi:opacity protein-like surface antigen
LKNWYMVLLLCLCSLVPSLASAADPAGYASVKLGYFMPNSDDDGLKDFDNEFSLGLAVGTKLSPNFAIELGWDYYSTKGNDTVSSGGVSYAIDAEVTTWSIPLTAKFILPVSKEIEVFMGAGVGYYDSQIDADGTLSGGGLSADLWSESDSASGIGYHLVAGADYKINRNVALGGEIKWCKAELDFEDISDDEINVGGTTLNLVVKYLF